ncbi:MAG TPA: MFS transporter [Streptosporangiaceae bacterium]
MTGTTLPRAVPGTSSWRLSAGRSFAAIAAVYVLFMAAASAPSPLYVVYQREWGFSAETLTVVFAVYVAGLLTALLVLGGLSDHVGRRPVLAAAIVGEAAALVMFTVADGVPLLLAARLVQGVATGIALTALGATLVDLNPPQAPGRAGTVNSVVPAGGLAAGALGCGALVQFGPAPTRLVWVLLLAATGLAAVVVAVIPDAAQRRPGALASLAPRLGVPGPVRPEFYALVPIMLASWALGGLYLALGPSVAAGLFGLTNHLVGGLVVTLLCGPGAITAFALRTRPAPRLVVPSAVLLAAGTAVALGGVLAHSVALAGAGTAVAGVGFGMSSLATFGTLGRLAAPAQRSELFAVAFVISYLAFSVPAVLAGIASTHAGLRPTSIVYAVSVIALSLAAVAAQRLRRAPAGTPAP